jgi:hemerythrin-like domain-containing protein
MLELIDELREEHARILDMLNEIVELGIGTKEAQEKIRSMQSDLMRHLKKEDDRLYSVLRKEAAKRKELKRLLESAPKDMEAITEFAAEFFKKYSSGGSGLEFEGDLKILIATIKNRILNEESIFFDEYESLFM